MVTKNIVINKKKTVRKGRKDNKEKERRKEGKKKIMRETKMTNNK